MKTRVKNIQVTSYIELKNNYSLDIVRTNNHYSWILNPTSSSIGRLFRLLEKYPHWETRTLVIAYDGMPTLTTTFYPTYKETTKFELV